MVAAKIDRTRVQRGSIPKIVAASLGLVALGAFMSCPVKRFFNSVCYFAITAVVVGCAGANARWHEFGVGGHATLCVSDSDMDPNLIAYNSESKSLKLRQGWTPGFGFLFDATRVKADIPSFHVVQEFRGHPYVNALSGSVGFLDLADRTRYGASMRARKIDEIWRSTGSCDKSEITPIGDGLYRAMCSARDDYASIWNRTPDSSGRMPSPDDFVLATCRYESIDTGKYAGSVMQTCSRVIVIDEFIVDYRFQESNLGLIPAMDALLTKRLTEWKKNCSANR